MATSPTPVTDPAVDEPITEPLDDQSEGEEAPAPTPAEIKALQAQLSAEKRARKAAEQLAEERKATKEFWEKRSQAAPAPAAEQHADPLDDFDWLKTLTDEADPAAIKRNIAKVVKAQIAAELKRGNYVSREEAEGYVAQMIEGATAVNALTRDFPDLRNERSEFFAEFQKQIAALEADPTNKAIPIAKLQRIAALETQAAMVAAGKGPARETDEDRYERIANQRGGSRGRGQATDDNHLTAAERAAAARYGLTEKQYLEGKRLTNYGPGLTVERLAREYGNG